MPEFRADLDLYEVLQVHPRASDAIIRKAYRTLMLDQQVHPDRGGSEERAKILNEAYAVLSDPERRAAYDRFREALVQDAAQNSPVILVICPNCGKKNRVPRDLLRHSRCGNCKVDFDRPPRRGAVLYYWLNWLRGRYWGLDPTAVSLARRLAILLLILLLVGLAAAAVFSAVGGWLPLARLLDRLGKKEAAVEIYQNALRDGAGYWEDKERWAALSLDLGNPQEALAILEAIVADNPSRISAFLLLGQTYSQMERWTDAARSFQQVIEREPENTDAHFQLGHAFARSQDLEQAAYHFNRVLAYEPRNASALFNLGTVYAHMGRPDEAIAAFRIAAAADPNDSEALAKLGELYARRQRWSESYDALRQALKRKPDDPESHFTLAQVLYWQGKNPEALAEYRSSLQAWQRIPEEERRSDLRLKMQHALRMLRELQNK